MVLLITTRARSRTPIATLPNKAMQTDEASRRH